MNVAPVVLTAEERHALAVAPLLTFHVYPAKLSASGGPKFSKDVSKQMDYAGQIERSVTERQEP